MREKFPRIFPHDTLREAIRRFHAHGLDRIPVVDPKNIDRLVGIITQADILNIYRKPATTQQQ